MARTVLVVDDEALVRDVIAAMLEDLGCRVAQAATAPARRWPFWQPTGGSRY